MLTLPHIWIIYTESRAGIYPQAIFQPDCLIGHSETWDNPSIITNSAMMFSCCSAGLHTFDNLKIDGVTCNRVLMIFRVFQSSYFM